VPSMQDPRALDACVRDAAARGRGSPALPLGGVPGHQPDRRPAQNVERAHAHVTKGSGGRSCLAGGRRRKGAERPLRRACERAVEHKEEEKGAGVIAHRDVQNQKRQRERKEKRRSGLASTAIPAALRRTE
jgi:hypothetical protein